MQAQLWTACYESIARALRVGTYVAGVREMRADCAPRAVEDLSRLTHLRNSTTPLEHLTIFPLSYIFLPSLISLAKLRSHRSEAMPPPRSGLVIVFTCPSIAEGKGFAQGGGDGKWRGVLDFLLDKDRTGTGKDNFSKMFNQALTKHTSPAPSPSRTTRPNLLRPSLRVPHQHFPPASPSFYGTSAHLIDTFPSRVGGLRTASGYWNWTRACWVRVQERRCILAILGGQDIIRAGGVGGGCADTRRCIGAREGEYVSPAHFDTRFFCGLSFFDITQLTSYPHELLG
jgi:hypothetical protein